MIEVFQYWLDGATNAGSAISPRLATRPYIEAANGQIVKGSSRTIDEDFMADGKQVIEGFTGQQIAYLRDLISLGAITTSPGERSRSWLSRLVDARLVTSKMLSSGKLIYTITILGRVAIAQLL